MGMLAAACGAPASMTPGQSETSVTYVGVAGGAITMGMTQSPTGCNPHTVAGDTFATRMILGAVLPSPYTVNSDGVPTQNPNLISQAELINTKPETIVYTLNPKAVWADGVAITAADFRYAWDQERALHPGDPGAVSDTQGYKDIASVVGTNAGRTVTVIFGDAVRADWQMLFANLLPAHVLETSGWDPSCSTLNQAIDLSGGPFALKAVSGSSVTLSDNPKWWGVTANAKTITVRFASSTDQLAQWNALRGHSGRPAHAPSRRTYLTDMASLPSVETEVDNSATLLQLEMASGPNTHLSPDMRFALALFIDRQAIVNTEATWALPSTQVANSHIYAQGDNRLPRHHHWSDRCAPLHRRPPRRRPRSSAPAEFESTSRPHPCWIRRRR